MIETNQNITLMTNDNDGIVALMQSLGVYDEMLSAQSSGQDVILVHDDYAFIWSVDEYILYHSTNPEELNRVIADFHRSATEIESAVRH